MKPIYTHFAGALALTTGIAACVPPPRPASPVQTTPAPAPRPAPTPSPTPTYSSWMDTPQTPGDWSYRALSGGGTARFGPAASEPRFTLRCDAAARSIILTRLGGPVGATQMTVRSESQTRALAAVSQADGAVVARLSASDPLLDAMALSKGRFAIEVAGASTLYLPSWAEVTRVIEDCR